MANKISLTPENTKYLRYAFGHFFPDDSVYSADKPYLSGEFNWKNRVEFIDFVYRLTGVYIKSERDFGNIKKAQLAVEDLASSSEEKEKPTESNIPDKEAREQQETERQKREVETKASQEKAQKEVTESIIRKQEFFKKQQEREVYREALKNKKVIITPAGNFTQVTLTQYDKKTLFDLSQAAKGDPNALRSVIEQKIRESVAKSSDDIRQNVTDSVIRNATDDIMGKLQSFGEFNTPENIPNNFIVYNPASPLIAITDPNNSKLKEIITDEATRKVLTQNAKAIAMSMDSELSVNSALTEPLFKDSKIITELLYPKNIAQFQVSEDQEEEKTKNEGIEIDLENVYDLGEKTWDLWQKIANKEITTEEIFLAAVPEVSLYLPPVTVPASITKLFPSTIGAVDGLGTSTITTLWITGGAITFYNPGVAGLLTSGGASQLLVTASPIISSSMVSFVSASGKFGFFAGGALLEGGGKIFAAGLNLGKSSIGVALSSQGIRIAATGVIGKVLGVAAGLLSGPVGWIIAAVSFVASLIPWDKIKKALPYILAGLVGLGAYLIAGPVVGVVVGLGTFGLLGAGAAGPISAAAVGGKILGLLAAIGGIVFATIGMPILITMLVVPVVVVLILFIINSGAYIVPPTASTLTSSNPYIQVDKVASPAGPFQNSNLPLKIEYTVTVTAKKSTLTNISLKDSCRVVSKSGTTTCPTPSSLTPPDIISPSSPYTFKYTENYSGSTYQDSFVINTFTVIADSAEQKGQEVPTTASIKIGNPPDVCPNGWPVTGSHKITQTPGGGYSHTTVEAMDFSMQRGTQITSTTTGTATVVYTTGPYSPVYVDVISNCGGKPVAVRYAHFSAVFVKSGQQITFGQTLGLSGVQGTGPHLHYEFRGGIIMQSPFIPKPVPRGCSNDSGTCGYIP